MPPRGDKPAGLLVIIPLSPGAYPPGDHPHPGQPGLGQRPPVYPGLVRRALTLLATACIGVSLAACSSAPAPPAHPAPSPVSSAPLSLSCSDSVGQQGQDHETVTGGVEGLGLPGS